MGVLGADDGDVVDRVCVARSCQGGFLDGGSASCTR